MGKLNHRAVKMICPGLCSNQVSVSVLFLLDYSAAQNVDSYKHTNCVYFCNSFVLLYFIQVWLFSVFHLLFLYKKIREG